jgi:succinoglycan biosynthesis transport protein ExoP
VLLEEPQALAIALNAMAQSYDWVLCRLDASGSEANDFLSACGPCADAIVIASNEAADDPKLVTLYQLACETGAPQVLVAQDREAALRREMPGATLQETPLRLSA